jgi:hypothetical protein
MILAGACGGGGWADPAARSPEASERDLESGYLTGGGEWRR